MIKSSINKIANISISNIKSLFLRLGILGFVGMWACKTNDPLATPMPNTNYSIIDGDTVKTVVFKDYKKLKDFDPNGKNYIVVGDTILTYKEPKLHTPPAKDPDLSKLKNNDDPELKGKPLRMIAIGGSLTAGVRDGGYFNEGILTSYPNLIARQMKLKKFEQPLFEPSDFNGFGRKVPTSFNPTGGPVPKFNEVKNNSGVESVDEKGVKLKVSRNVIYDNLAIAKGKRDVLVSNMEIFKILKENYKINTDNYFTYVNRLFNQEKPSFYSLYNKVDFDIYTLEVGSDDLLEFILSGGKTDISNFTNLITNVFNTSASLGDSPELKVVRYLSGNNPSKKKAKGFVSNIPEILEFPFFKLYTTSKVLNQFGSNRINYLINENNYTYLTLSNDEILIPNTTIDSLLSPKVNISLKKGIYEPLTKRNILTKSDIRSIDSYIDVMNQQFLDFKKVFGVEIVDLKSLYKKVLSGNYITEDGVKVDPSWPNGNFFSTDGINPTAFGQSIIANEFIKTINLTQKMDIPLIPTREYLNIK